MNRRLHRGIVSMLALLVFVGCAVKSRPVVMGAYRLEDGRLLSIRKSVGSTLRGRFYRSGAGILASRFCSRHDCGGLLVGRTWKASTAPRMPSTSR